MNELAVDERLVLEGDRVKFAAQKRAAVADSGVVVDYLRFTVKKGALIHSGIAQGENDDDAYVCRALAVEVAHRIGFIDGEMRKGRDFYAHTFTITTDEGREVGSVSGGGDGQRGTFCVTLKGEACTFGASGWEHRVHSLMAVHEAKITRIDLARDHFNGEFGGVDAAREAYRSGGFSYRGRDPKPSQAGNWEHGIGRTWYVGKRESGKMFRGYEKGHQYGDEASSWWRAEVELRGNQRVIPLECLIAPADYFAGSYAFCASLVSEALPIKVPTGHRVAEASVERVLRWFERTVAPSLVHLSLRSGFEWLLDLAERESSRPLPKALRGLSQESIQAGVSRAMSKFSSSDGPGIAAPSCLPA